MNPPRAPRYRLIVGLGNPGREYEITRHNIGFMLVDRLAQGRADWRRERSWQGDVCEVGGSWLLKPQTYMNLSGESVRSVSGFYKIPPDSILVVLDDLSLGLGKLRLRLGGSAGGHNGLKSILECLGTREVARLRVGIGGAGPGEAAGHVLGKFRKDEWPRVEEALERAEAAIAMIQSDGMERAMNAFN